MDPPIPIAVTDPFAKASALQDPPFPLLSNNPIHNSLAMEHGYVGGGVGVDVEAFRTHIHHFTSMVNGLEQKVKEVSLFYTTKQQDDEQKHQGLKGKDKDKEKLISNNKNIHKKNQAKEGASTKRMQELTRQFGTILRQISQDKWAWPFLEPVDVEGLGLDDYYQIIKKPMDFDTIQNKMKAKDSSNGYKNVREIYADVKLVFANAMKYNDETHDVHCMAKKLSEKFEEKWLQLLPKVIEEETKQKEEAQAHADVQILKDVQISKEASFAKIARDTNSELNELTLQLEELREMVIKKCRKISTEGKRRILASFSKLPPEQINRAISMITQHNPSVLSQEQEVFIDMDAQSESTLWRLKSCINSSLTVEPDCSATGIQNTATKRKREVTDAILKNAKCRNKKP